MEPALVARARSAAALADSLRAAVALPQVARDAYRERARELVAPYSHAELRRRLESDVLRVLLPPDSERKHPA
jgi:hypothetical protein